MRKSLDWSVTTASDLRDTDSLSVASLESSRSTPRELCQSELCAAVDYVERNSPCARYDRRAVQSIITAAWKMDGALKKPEPVKKGIPAWQRHALQLRIDVRGALLDERQLRS